MPYVKSIPIRTSVEKSLSYILNPDKTEQLLYTTSLNCMTSAKDAYEEMKFVYESFAADKFNAPLPKKGKGSVKAIHYIQSFDPEDNISPELAHRITKTFVRKTFGDDVQVVIATHSDRRHVHSHIIVNSYTLTGKKLYANLKTLKEIRNISDSVALAFGIQPIKQKEGDGKGISYYEWEQKQRGTSWKQKLRIEIDSLIESVRSVDELIYELKLKGYEVRKGEYISLKAHGQQRFIRTKTLGEEYTVDSLISRIMWRDVGGNAPLHDEPSPLRESYQIIIGQVTQLAADHKKVQRRYDNTAPYSPQNDLDVQRLAAQLTIISRDRIHSIVELEGKIESAKTAFEQARNEINVLTCEYERLASLLKQVENYYSLCNKTNLSEFEQLQLTVSRQSILNNGINSQNDIECLKAELLATNKKLAERKNTFARCQQMYDVYSDIAKTYYEISQGDYISKMIAEEKKKRSIPKHGI